jgi:hypothetical protein
MVTTRKKTKIPPAVTVQGEKQARYTEATISSVYGARYLDARTSRWISADPALGEYVPAAPLGDEEWKHNQNLPGMGGVFNVVNLHVYHYAANNPVKYVDPDGRRVRYKSGEFAIYIKYENSINGQQGEMLEPGRTYPAEGDARVDGAIAYNRVTGEILIYKINDSEGSPVAPVSFNVRQRKNGSYRFFMYPWSALKNWIGGLFKDSDEVASGLYFLDELPEEHALRDWYNTALQQQPAVREWENQRNEENNSLLEME